VGRQEWQEWVRASTKAGYHSTSEWLRRALNEAALVTVADERVQAHVHPRAKENLERIARVEGVAMGEILRRALDEYAERWAAAQGKR
jgi:hypothetical protein